jgi:sugar-specific transcriptional regulator TrmB
MASGPEDVEILNSLGLTINAAKIFLTLSELGTATAKTISKTSGVAREVVYQLMPSLVKKGLVEEALTSPKSFKAIPLEKAYNQLLQRKREENRKIRQKIEKSLKKKKTSNLQVEDKYQTTIIKSGGQQQHFKIHKEFQKVQKSLDTTFSLGKFLQWSQRYAEEDMNELKKKNIAVRIITEERLRKILAESPEIFSTIFSKLNSENFRYTKNSPPVELIIFDKKTLFLSTTEESNINRMRWLCSNNPFLLKMANSYYETLWENAEKLDEDDLNQRFATENRRQLHYSRAIG